MEKTLSERQSAVEAVKLTRSEHFGHVTIRHYECDGVDPDLAFSAIMGVAIARAYRGDALKGTTSRGDELAFTG
jgi:hypothetical protein